MSARPATTIRDCHQLASPSVVASALLTPFSPICGVAQYISGKANQELRLDRMRSGSRFADYNAGLGQLSPRTCHHSRAVN
jgi:hypothetical protein